MLGDTRHGPVWWKCEEQADYEGGQGGHLQGGGEGGGIEYQLIMQFFRT